MSTAKIVALILWVVAVVIFGFVGFEVIETAKYNLVALGLAAAWLGQIVYCYVP